MSISLADIQPICLSINIDRYKYLCKCMEVVGLKTPIFFQGVRHPKSGAEGCKLGHIAIMMMARCSNLDYVLVLEDDAYPRPDVKEKFDTIIKDVDSIDPDWGMITLGRNGDLSFWDKPTELFWNKYKTDKQRNVFKPKWKVLTDNIINIPKNPNGSHAYIVKRNFYTKWIHSLVRNDYSDIALGNDNFDVVKNYWTKELLFTNKQIDNKCMTGIQKTQVGGYLYPYFYDKDYTGVAAYFKTPPKGFVDELVKEN